MNDEFMKTHTDTEIENEIQTEDLKDAETAETEEVPAAEDASEGLAENAADVISDIPESTDAIEVCDTVEEKKFDTKGARKVFCRIGVALFVVFVLMFSVAQISMLLLPDTLVNQGWFIYLVSFVSMYVIAFPIGYLIICGIKRTKPDRTIENKMNFPTFARLFVSAACIMHFGAIIGNFYTMIFSFMKWTVFKLPESYYESAVTQTDTLSIIVQIIFVAVIAPIFEELIFRKAIIDRTKRFGYTPAVVFSGFLFGIFHGNFGQFFFAAMVGFLFGYVYVRTGKIRYTILLHAAVNIFSGVVPLVLSSLIDVDILNEMMTMTDTAEIIKAFISFMASSLIPFIMLMAHEMVYTVLAIVGLIFLIKDCRRYKAGLLKADPPMPVGTMNRTLFVNVGIILFVCGMLIEFIMSL